MLKVLSIGGKMEKILHIEQHDQSTRLGSPHQNNFQMERSAFQFYVVLMPFQN